MRAYLPGIDKEIKVYGRTKMINPLPLFFNGSGIEFITDGSKLVVDFTTDYDIYEQWIRVEIDKVTTIRMPLNKGNQSVMIYNCMNPNNKRRVVIYREVQAMPGDKSNLLFINSVNTDGSLYPVENKSYNIEIIGDSITSGEGLAGSKGISEWNSFVFSSENHYGIELSKKLNADLTIISQSGWGVYSGWDNNIYCNLPSVYEKLCGFATGPKQTIYDTCKEYDFAKKMDVVIINLGTNDLSAFNQPAWIDPDSGIAYKQVKISEHEYEEESVDRFVNAAVDLLHMVRKHNKSAHIIWAYGMISQEFSPYIERAINLYTDMYKDDNIHAILLPELLEEWEGSNGHPGALSHQKACQVLYDYLIKYLKNE